MTICIAFALAGNAAHESALHVCFAALPLTNPFNELLCVLTTNSRNEPGFHLWAELGPRREHATNRANFALFAIEDHVEQRIAYGFPCSSQGEKCLG